MTDKKNSQDVLAMIRQTKVIEPIDSNSLSDDERGEVVTKSIQDFLNVLAYYEDNGRKLTLKQLETRTAFGRREDYDWGVVIDTINDYEEAKDNPFNLPLTPDEMMSLFTVDALQSEEIEPDDYIFGESEDVGGMSTSDFCQIYGGTGSGKTLFSLSLAVSAAAGVEFIGWPCKKPRRVLYLDGELPEKTIRKRLDNATAHLSPEHAELVKKNLTVISRERLIRCTDRDLSPLDKAEGMDQVLWLVKTGKIELAVFDSRFCLLAADMKEAGSMPKSLILALRHNKCAQLWVHHTGKSADRGAYGDKTAEFLMDTNIHFSQPEKGRFEIYFSADKGGKCRHREPSNEHYYQDMALRFEGGQWFPDGPAGTCNDEDKETTVATHVIRAISELTNKKVDKAGGYPDKGHSGEPVAKITRDEIRSWFISMGVFEAEPNGLLSSSKRKQINTAITNLMKTKLAGNESGIWLLKP